MQSAETQEFITYYKALWRNGAFKTQQEFADKMEWSRVSLSLVLNGEREVPKHIVSKLLEVFRDEIKNIEGVVEEKKTNDAKDELIEQLKSERDFLRERLKEILQREEKKKAG